MALFGQSDTPKKTDDTVRPLFGEGGRDGTRHESLSAYLARHFEKQADSQPARPATGSAGGRFSTAKSLQTAESETTAEVHQGLSGPRGQFLNTLDVEMVAGLEQYMPTPAFRLRVVKDRLEAEIRELEDRLGKYGRMGDPAGEMRAQSEIMAHRLGVLHQHRERVLADLQAMYPLGGLFDRVARFYGATTRAGGAFLSKISGWLRASYEGEARREMAAASRDLADLQVLFDHSNRQGGQDAASIWTLAHRYEQDVRRLEAAAGRLREETFMRRTWQFVRRLIQ